MYKITIVWGEDREVTKTYTFKNETQYDFFMKGVNEAEGWTEYDVIKEEVNNEQE